MTEWACIVMGVLAVAAVALTVVLIRRERAAQQRLAASVRAAERYRVLFQANPQPMWLYDLDTLRFVTVNDAAIRHYGYSQQQFLSMTITDLQIADDVTADLARSGPRATMVLPVRHRKQDGSAIDVELTTHSLVVDGRRMGLALAHDVTERKRAQQLELDRRSVVELVARNQPLETILEQLCSMMQRQEPELRGAVLLRRPQAGISYVGATGLTSLLVLLAKGVAETMVGAARVLPSARQQGMVWDLTRYPFWQDCQDAAVAHQIERCWAVPILSKEGEALGAVLAFQRGRTPLDDAGLGLLNLAARLASIALEQRQLSDRLAYEARHDKLTGLPNRVLFDERCREALARAEQSGHMAAILYVDLDRFKLVNDILGHKVGDALLRKVAERLRATLRPDDTLARMGGDEFTIVMPELTGHAEAARVAQAAVDTLSAAFEVQGHELFVTGSIGVSFYPQDGRDVETLQRRADSAMYRAKNQGKNNFQCFAPEMEAAPQRLELESQLRRAIAQGELVLFYQPQFESARQRLTGFEALIRWHHPQLGMISPAEFIPIAEESGLIASIGAWAVDEVCRQLAAWRKEGRPAIKIAVNVSTLQFGRTDFVETVSQALARHSVEGSLLEVELTESMVMRDIETSSRQMAKLREIGVSVAIDDFGTGYSSLSYLQRLPVDTLKIDQSFVRQIESEAATPPLIQAIIALAHGLGMAVTAEGVETEHQLAVLEAAGCDKAQGYLLGRPLPAPLLFWPAARPASGGLLALGEQTSAETDYPVPLSR